MQDIIAATGILLTTFKKIKDLYDRADYLELKSHILDMNEQILNTKELALELKQENLSLKEELAILKSSTEKKLIMKNKLYYDEDGNGPYCPNCYNKKELILMSRVDMGIYTYYCTKCKFGIK